MIPWYLNPKNVCLMVFGMIMLTMGAAFLWQRGTISDLRETHMADVADIEALKAQRADLQGQIDDYPRMAT